MTLGCGEQLFKTVIHSNHASLVAQMVKHLPAIWETQIQSLGWEDLLEKEMATHSSIPAWRIPGTEELGRLQSMVSKESDTTERLHFNVVSTGGEVNTYVQCILN